MARTAPILAGSLIGGYLAAEATEHRHYGGVVLAAGGVVSLRSWVKTVGWGKALVLSVIYLAGFTGSHPLAKKIGAWPSVLTVAATSAVAAHVISDSALSHSAA